MTATILLSSSSTPESVFIGFLTALAFGLILWFYRKTSEMVSEIKTSSTLGKDPENITALKKQGFSALRKSNLSEAIHSFEKILQIKNDDFEAPLGLANSLHLVKQYCESKKYLEHLSNQDHYVYDKNLPYATLENMALNVYFCGHIKFMEGDIEGAIEQRKLVEATFAVSPDIKKFISNLKLY